MIIDVPYIDQTGAGAFTGCECASAAMLLRFLGKNIDIERFFADYVDKGPIYERGGILYGADPRKVFVGDPYTTEAMGCYAPVIKNSLERVIGGEYEVIDETGCTLEYLCEKYIDRGVPVIVWATINMRDIIVGPKWVLTDSGEDFTWLSNEHCMVLVGYDGQSYIVNDPWTNNGVIGYEKELFADRFRKQHSQAVGIIKKSRIVK